MLQVVLILLQLQHKVFPFIILATPITTPTATPIAAIRALYFGEDNFESVENRRLHHQLLPNILFYEGTKYIIVLLVIETNYIIITYTK